MRPFLAVVAAITLLYLAPSYADLVGTDESEEGASEYHPHPLTASTHRLEVTKPNDKVDAAVVNQKPPDGGAGGFTSAQKNLQQAGLPSPTSNLNPTATAGDGHGGMHAARVKDLGNNKGEPIAFADPGKSQSSTPTLDLSSIDPDKLRVSEPSPSEERHMQACSRPTPMKCVTSSDDVDHLRTDEEVEHCKAQCKCRPPEPNAFGAPIPGRGRKFANLPKPPVPPPPPPGCDHIPTPAEATRALHRKGDKGIYPSMDQLQYPLQPPVIPGKADKGKPKPVWHLPRGVPSPKVLMQKLDEENYYNSIPQPNLPELATCGNTALHTCASNDIDCPLYHCLVCQKLVTAWQLTEELRIDPCQDDVVVHSSIDALLMCKQMRKELGQRELELQPRLQWCQRTTHAHSLPCWAYSMCGELGCCRSQTNQQFVPVPGVY